MGFWNSYLQCTRRLRGATASIFFIYLLFYSCDGGDLTVKYPTAETTFETEVSLSMSPATLHDVDDKKIASC